MTRWIRKEDGAIKPLKILLLSFYYSPDLCAGAFRSESLVRALEKICGGTLSIDILTTQPNRFPSYVVEAPEYEKNGQTEIYRFPLPCQPVGIFGQARCFASYVRNVRAHVSSCEYDLVFATSSRLMTAVLGCAIAKKKHARLYLDMRDIFVENVSELYPKPLSIPMSALFARLERWAVNQADHVNLVSKGFGDYFIPRYSDKTFSFLTNGVDREALSQALSSPTILAGSPLTVLYAGNVGEGQGLHHILPSLARYYNSELKFIVLGDGTYLRLLKNLCAGLENVEFHPAVPRDQIHRFYHQADVLFLHLNHYKAFKRVLPSKLFEYAASGKPIWAGVYGYAGEFIRSEIENAVVFDSCNLKAAIIAYKQLELVSIDRSAFIEKYSRERIMNKMGLDIVHICSDE